MSPSVPPPLLAVLLTGLSSSLGGPRLLQHRASVAQVSNPNPNPSFLLFLISLTVSDMFFSSSSINLRKSVADVSSSSCGIKRPRWPRTPLRNGAGEPSAIEGTMAGEDDIVWPLTGNDDLIATSLVP
jgi:hypothetical protein